MKSRIILLFMSIFGFLSCLSGTKPTDSHIRSFRYSYDGTIGANSFSYEIICDSTGNTLSVEMMEHADYGTMKTAVSDEFMENLRLLCYKHNVMRWDGYDKFNKYVCDGSGFSLSVGYEDGSRMSAHGMNMVPDGYRNFENEMAALFAPVVEAMLEEARQQKIAEGISGEMTSMLVNFMQRGTSGSDKYEVLIRRDYDFSVRVKSQSGEFFPVGTYNFSGGKDVEVDWTAFAALVEKHKLINWYDYNKAAEDYSNAEWFQIDMGFTECHISAMGTEHPEGYDAFRRDFLMLLKATVEKSGLQPN